jgi:hypothetical protein
MVMGKAWRVDGGSGGRESRFFGLRDRFRLKQRGSTQGMSKKEEEEKGVNYRI